MHKTRQLMVFSLWLVLAGCAHQSMHHDDRSTPSLERLAYESQLDGREREFFVYLPPGYADEPERDWPVMLFLHGNGERGNGRDELGFVLSHGPIYEAWVQKRDRPFIIISPQLPMFGMDEHADYLRDRDPEQMASRLESGTPPRPEPFDTPQPMTGVPATESMKDQSAVLPGGWDRIEDDLIMMLDRVEREYRTDPQRQYLTGLSYGGFGTWYLASHHPERFAAIAPVVGWGHPKLMAPIADNQLPLWAFAAGRDPVVKIEDFYPGLNRLEALGHNDVRFTNHEGMGHDAWTRVYQSDDFYQWLLEHERAEGK
ncbi:carboxylesterase family protein [Marinimicrobium sp. C2-29]|uniref:carboxylesterase family protein n=1 Tax=Marinimicrobium sp. C2-29 TaxID=3139825 RepID=UPI00313978C9